MNAIDIKQYLMCWLLRTMENGDNWMEPIEKGELEDSWMYTCC